MLQKVNNKVIFVIKPIKRGIIVKYYFTPAYIS